MQKQQDVQSFAASSPDVMYCGWTGFCHQLESWILFSHAFTCFYSLQLLRISVDCFSLCSSVRCHDSCRCSEAKLASPGVCLRGFEASATDFEAIWYGMTFVNICDWKRVQTELWHILLWHSFHRGDREIVQEAVEQGGHAWPTQRLDLQRFLLLAAKWTRRWSQWI